MDFLRDAEPTIASWAGMNRPVGTEEVSVCDDIRRAKKVHRRICDELRNAKKVHPTT
jgi:hypothetical protein